MVQVKAHMQLKDQAQCIPPACQFSRLQQQIGKQQEGYVLCGDTQAV